MMITSVTPLLLIFPNAAIFCCFIILLFSILFLLFSQNAHKDTKKMGNRATFL